MVVQFLCPACEQEMTVALPLAPGPWKCPKCLAESPKDRSGGAALSLRSLRRGTIFRPA